MWLSQSILSRRDAMFWACKADICFFDGGAQVACHVQFSSTAKQNIYFFFNIAIQYYSNQCQSYSTSHDIGIVAQPSTMDCRASAASAASGDPPFSCHSTTMHHGHELGACVFGAFKWVPDGTPLQNLKHAYKQIYIYICVCNAKIIISLYT